MLLKSITLKNFRQIVDDHIDFSTDKERNVTLIIGENGTGKTTFAQAFFWCLYGQTSFTDKNLLNRTVSEKMLPDQQETVKVVLELTHGSAEYEIIRTQDYKKNYNNKVIAANTVLNIAVKSADGNTRYLKPLECETEVKKILPNELSSYFFFDGERIEKMSKEIAAGKKSNSFANAVTGLTGLNGILAALDHLSPTKKASSVIGKFEDAYVSDSSGKMSQLTKTIDSLQSELNRIESRLFEIDEELDSAETSKSNFELEIKQYADGEKLQNERDKLTKNIIAAKNTRSQFIKSMCSTFNSDMTSFFSISMVKRALEIISKSDIDGKDIPEMHTKTIEFLLNRGTCICGTQLMDGSVPYKNLVDLIDFLPPQSIGTVVRSFKKDTRIQYSKDITLFNKIGEQLSTISQQNDMIDEFSEQLALISEKLEGDNVREQVRSINTQIKACSEIITARKDEQKKLLNRQGAAKTEKSLKETSRSELSLMDKNNQHIEMCKELALRIYEDLSSEYKIKEKQIRDKLENYINEIFKTIYDGGLSISIDEKYNISVYVNDFEGGVETSTAQSISVIFAFISAIIKMAKENRYESGDESYAEPYPLVMDAPLSSFDKRRIKAICDALPETAEQVIIFIKDTDGDLAEEHLASKVRTRHHFIKIDEFNTKLD